jgi:hypothetical protein
MAKPPVNRIFSLQSLVIAAIFLVALSVGTWGNTFRVRADDLLDEALPNGHFYRQANGLGGAGPGGYSIVDDVEAAFWSDFQRLGGVDRLGYPASQRFRLSDGFLYQATQGALLQWRPELGRTVLANTFEMFEQRGLDDWLLAMKGIPKPIQDDGSGGDWSRARAIRMSWLTDEAIRSYYLTNPNPAVNSVWSEDAAIELYGLPMSLPERHGPFVSQRFQRVVLQRWVESVPKMPAPRVCTRIA